MAAQVLSFFQRSPRHAPQPADWSQQELAEFYRVESALIRAGIRVGTDRGMSDENEPWFIFFRSDDGEVVLHFARIDGEYLIAGPAYEEIARGFDFSTLVRNMVARHPLIRRSDSGSNLSIHPAALLVAVVGTAFFKTGEARAAETGATNAQSGHAPAGRPALLTSSSNTGLTGGVAPIAFQQAPSESVQLPVSQAVLILAAAMFASDYGIDTNSVDPAAQAAIAAAAASLDFGSAGVGTASSNAGLALPGTTHAVVVDNTPAQTVSTVLSLVAVLSSLPHAAEAPASAADGLLSLASASAHHEVALTTLPSASEAANWTIDVRLGVSFNGLPAIEAVQLIRGVVGETGAQKISVIEVAKLPDVLADLIAKGEHYTVTPASPTAPTLHPVVADPTPAAPVTPSEGDTTAQAPTPPPTVTHPIETPLTPAPTDTAPATPAFASHDLVKQFINYFIAHTDNVEIIVSGAEVAMFDARVLHDVGAVTDMTAMTFHLDDGTSISLVGNHSSFLNDGNLV